jgi:hypothetical protein
MREFRGHYLHSHAPGQSPRVPFNLTWRMDPRSQQIIACRLCACPRHDAPNARRRQTRQSGRRKRKRAAGPPVSTLISIPKIFACHGRTRMKAWMH